MFARGGVAVLSLVVIAAVGVTAATALRARRAPAAQSPAAEPLAVPAADSAATDPELTTTDSSSLPEVAEQPAASVTALQAAPVPAPTVPTVTPTALVSPSPTTTAKQVALVVPVGRSALRDTMVAERAGDTVRVSFDLLLSRTRRPEKFEAIMRSTLPQVYGASVDSALKALPVGAVARAGDLITTLPARGFHIPLTDGRTLAVWPVTREGRDGPLVVAYRAVAMR